MRVRANVPEGVKWESLKDMLGQSKIIQTADNREVIENHFAWLLQISSWGRGMNWDPKEDYIEVELPLGSKFENLSVANDYRDMRTGVSRDVISDILLRIIDEVPLERVLSHFNTRYK